MAEAWSSLPDSAKALVLCMATVAILLLIAACCLAGHALSHAVGQDEAERNR